MRVVRKMCFAHSYYVVISQRQTYLYHFARRARCAGQKIARRGMHRLVLLFAAASATFGSPSLDQEIDGHRQRAARAVGAPPPAAAAETLPRPLSPAPVRCLPSSRRACPRRARPLRA